MKPTRTATVTTVTMTPTKITKTTTPTEKSTAAMGTKSRPSPSAAEPSREPKPINSKRVAAGAGAGTGAGAGAGGGGGSMDDGGDHEYATEVQRAANSSPRFAKRKAAAAAAEAGAVGSRPRATKRAKTEYVAPQPDEKVGKLACAHRFTLRYWLAMRSHVLRCSVLRCCVCLRGVSLRFRIYFSICVVSLCMWIT